MQDGTKYGQSLETLANLSGESTATVQRVMKALLLNIAIGYTENQDQGTYVPHIGNMKFIYAGSEVTAEGLKARISIDLDPDKSLSVLIGELVDNNLNMFTQLLTAPFMATIEEKMGGAAHEQH